MTSESELEYLFNMDSPCDQVILTDKDRQPILLHPCHARVLWYLW